MTITVTGNSASVQYETLLIQLAQAMKAGDRQQANELRRAMEMPERELDNAMMNRFDGLSADLYMLEGKEYFERIDPAQATPDYLGKDLKKAWENEDWKRVLALLRQDGSFLSQEQRAYLRSVAYEKLGQLRSAFVFMDYAARQNSTDVVYRYFCLEYLMALGENEEAVERAQAYIADRTTPPALLIEAAVVLIQTAREADATTANKQIETAIPALVGALGSKTGLDSAPREVIALGYVSLGFCLEFLGDMEQAASAYQLALVVDSRSDAAQKALRERLTSRNGSVSSDTIVPKDASKAVPSSTSFQTLKAQQIWLATGSDF